MALVSPKARPGGAVDFTYEEFPHWADADAQQLARLDKLVHDVLQPARTELGVPLYITSWYRPGDPKAHGSGAAADVVAGSPLSKDATFKLWLWIAQKLARGPAPRVGEVIYEQPKTGNTGHCHVTLPGFGGWGQVIYQTPDGRLNILDPFSFAVSGRLPSPKPNEPGAEGEPLYELPGIDVVVYRPRLPWWGWAIVGGVALWALLDGPAHD